MRIEIDFGEWARFADASYDAVVDGLASGVNRALDLWQIQAINYAPIGRYKRRRGGNLRANVKRTKATLNGLAADGAVVANAFNGGFNYAYYLHEVAGAKGYRPRTPGTRLDFLDEAARKQQARMEREIEREIKAEIRRRGLS